MDYSFDQLLRINKKHLNKAASLFSEVFYDDVLIKWLFPHNETRKENLFHYYKFRINYGLNYGEVYATSSNLEGLAVWIYSKKANMTFWRNFRAGGLQLYRNLGKNTVTKLSKLSDFVYTLHRKYATFPHLYLSPIGIDSIHQKKGYASGLIRPMLKRLDDEQMYCFLETQDRENVDIYLHYDFEVLNKVIIPDTDIEHWLMERKPRNL